MASDVQMMTLLRVWDGTGP